MGNWKKAEPQEAVSRGNWYSVFHDPELNELEARAFHSNQTLREAVARVTEARAVARESEADFYPTIDFDADGWTAAHVAERRAGGRAEWRDTRRGEALHLQQRHGDAVRPEL